MKSAQKSAKSTTATLPKIAEMAEPDRAMAKRLHAVIKASAPVLSPKLWYGMPAYTKPRTRTVGDRRRRNRPSVMPPMTPGSVYAATARPT